MVRRNLRVMINAHRIGQNSIMERRFGVLPFLVGAVLLGGCTPSEPVPSDTTPVVEDAMVLIPETATLERVGELIMDPMADSIHPDPRMAEMIRLGFQISQDPQTYASEFVGNDLTCGNCL